MVTSKCLSYTRNDWRNLRFQLCHSQSACGLHRLRWWQLIANTLLQTRALQSSRQRHTSHSDKQFWFYCGNSSKFCRAAKFPRNNVHFYSLRLWKPRGAKKFVKKLWEPYCDDTRNYVTMHSMVQLTSQLLSAFPNATISCAIFHKDASCIQPTGRVEPPQNSHAVYLNICSSLQNSSARTIYIIQCRRDSSVCTVARLWAGQSRDWLPVQARNASPSRNVHNDLRTTQGLFPGGTAARVWRSSLASIKNGAIPPPTLYSFMACTTCQLTFTLRLHRTH